MLSFIAYGQPPRPITAHDALAVLAANAYAIEREPHRIILRGGFWKLIIETPRAELLERIGLIETERPA